ncbi:alpha/beta hydrolase [Grimontia sp. NTOU-MAR1]|uniref:alpha/beta hydrolase n=1 Tax=Grimontia sp. NTOU-MAR1 TaxID=3111011 RepID=UPI002DBA38B3|nr:alpha/beta hydrolase [Grimontia sp. NTOU-MAR1]WRV99698.1 alpha/beta hydrolase [Grimontia sp. NTOU-MAR1]
MMKIKSTNKKIPIKHIDNIELFIEFVADESSKNTVNSLGALAEKVNERFHSYGVNRSSIKTLTIYVTSLNDFYENQDEIDKILRFKLAGNIGEVAVIQQEMVALEAAIEREPLSNDIVLRGYSKTELFDQYYTFLTAPDAPQIIHNWVETRPASHCETKEIVFGSSSYHHSLDLYLPKRRSKKMPLLIHIHGGYWQYTDKEIYAKVANSFTQYGIAVANLNYPQAPDVTISEIINSCRRGIHNLFVTAEEHGIDQNSITVAGHSAGAHLAAMMGLTNWSAFDASLPRNLFQTVIGFSGLYDLEPFTIIMRERLNLDSTQLTKASPVHFDASEPVNFSLYVGGNESDEFQRQTSVFAEYLQSHDMNSNTVVLENKNHFSTVDEFYSESTPTFCACLDLMLQKKPPKPPNR